MLQAEQFWHYSLRVYEQGGVKQHCLSLQNEFGLNVNMLLLCGFLTQHKIFVSAGILQALSQHIETIDQELKELRSNRIASKSLEQDLYRNLLKQELILEKSQQATLISVLNSLRNNGMEFIDQNKDNFMSYHQSLETADVQILNDIMSTKALILNA